MLGLSRVGLSRFGLSSSVGLSSVGHALFRQVLFDEFLNAWIHLTVVVSDMGQSGSVFLRGSASFPPPLHECTRGASGAVLLPIRRAAACALVEGFRCMSMSIERSRLCRACARASRGRERQGCAPILLWLVCHTVYGPQECHRSVTKSKAPLPSEAMHASASSATRSSDHAIRVEDGAKG